MTHNWVYLEVRQLEDGAITFQSCIVVAPDEPSAYRVGAQTLQTRQGNGEYPEGHMDGRFLNDWVVAL